MSQSEQRLSEFDVRQRSGDLAAEYGSGAEPESRMLGFVMFAGTIMILTGLFSNRLFDWLKEFADKQTGQTKPGGAPTQAETAAADNSAGAQN